MTMEWTDERLDAALRDLLDARANEIGSAALPVDVVSAQLADELDITVGTDRRSWRPVWRNSFMSNTLMFAMAGAAALLVAVVLGLYLSQPGGLIGPPAPSPSPEPSDPAEPGAHAMSTARSGHTATLLSDGRVLIAGGIDNWEVPFLSSAETYDQSTGQLTETGSMTGPRLWHTATLLADGRVLMTGGWVEAYAGAASTEIYDPASGTFSPSESMGSTRRDHTATLLPDGRVLIAGGRGGPGEFWQTAEVYDPESGRFAPTGLMTVARLGHTATLMADGRVLIAGGRAEASAEIYDPAAGTFSSTGSMAGLRGDHTATLLADGRVLIVGGCSLDNRSTCVDWPGFNAHAATEIYDPATGVFVAANPLTVGRQAHTATLLSDGRVLVTGGVASYWDNGRMSRRMSESERLSAEIWDPDSGSFSAAASMGAMRTNHTATLLRGGRVLIAGGQPTHELALASVELYYP